MKKKIKFVIKIFGLFSIIMNYSEWPKIQYLNFKADLMTIKLLY